jgi:ATP synthase F1 complex assembly factor 1
MRNKRGMFTYPSPRLLKDIVKIPILAMENREKIEEVWMERHKEDDARFGKVLGEYKFEMMMRNAKQFPMFMFPVHRENGFIVLVSQFQDRHCLLTGVEAFQKLGQNAHPVCVVTFYDELMEKKKVILARGDITDPVVNKSEMIRLYEDLLFAYTAESGIQKVREFNLRPQEFDFQRYFQETRPIV